jgi:hypothetical protein
MNTSPPVTLRSVLSRLLRVRHHLRLATTWWRHMLASMGSAEGHRRKRRVLLHAATRHSSVRYRGHNGRLYGQHFDDSFIGL